MKPKMQLFTISRAPVPCYLSLFTISAVENILFNLNNWSLLHIIHSKSNLSHRPGDLKNGQPTETRDIYDH